MKRISIGKKLIGELLELPEFEGHTEQWAYRALKYHSDSAEAENFRDYVLNNCHGKIITEQKF